MKSTSTAAESLSAGSRSGSNSPPKPTHINVGRSSRDGQDDTLEETVVEEEQVLWVETSDTVVRRFSPSVALKLFVFMHQVSFLISGIAQTIGTQWLYYQGAAEESGMLTLFANYLGMALVVLVPSSSLTMGSESSREHASPLPISVPSSPNPADSPVLPPSYTQLGSGSLPSPTIDRFSSSIDDNSNARSFSNATASARPPSREKRARKDREIRNGGKGNFLTRFFRRCWNGFATATCIKNEQRDLSWKDVLKVASMDVAANALITVGMFYVGSGLYQVIYSSVVAFTALFSKFFLKKSLALLQWGAIVVITAGLAMSALGARADDQQANEGTPITGPLDEAKVAEAPGTASRTLGASLCLIATILYAAIYTYNDRLLSRGARPPSPEKACVAIGTWTTVISGLWVVGYTVPFYDAVLVKPLLPDASILGVVGMYLLLVFASTAHNASYFVLLRYTGGVSTGVLQSLRAVAVFGLSHLWFCPSDKSTGDPGQCFNLFKVLSTAFVCSGVLLYSVANTPPPVAQITKTEMTVTTDAIVSGDAPEIHITTTKTTKASRR